MNRIALKDLAKQQIAGNIGVFLLMHLAAYAISAVLCIIPAVGALLGSVAAILFEFSFVIIFLALANGTLPEFKNIFDIFKNTNLCGNALLLEILISVFTFLWSLLLIVPGIIKGLSYSMAPYILAEKEYYISSSDAIKESMEMMEGHKMDLFVLSLSFIGWFLLCGITCGIASIYVIPYYRATMVNFYNSIKEKPQEQSGYTSVILD